jgi:hypothetical protein
MNQDVGNFSFLCCSLRCEREDEFRRLELNSFQQFCVARIINEIPTAGITAFLWTKP